MFFISSKKAFFFLEIFKFLYLHLPLFFSLSAIALEVDPRKILKFMTSSTVDRESNKEYFYGKIMQKICFKS